MARIILVYDSLPLEFSVLEVYQQGQVESGSPIAHSIFIKSFNALQITCRKGNKTECRTALPVWWSGWLC